MEQVGPSGLLPAPGKVPCAQCFPDRLAPWGQSILSNGGWQLENNPLAWGGRDPRVMVLGFSKGDRQCAAIRAGAVLENIAFAGMRGNLSAILRRLGVLGEEQTVDQIIATNDADFHFGSLVRCSIAKLDPTTHRPVKAGDVIAAAATDPIGKAIVASCAERFLKQLPARLRVVVFLSNDDAWTDFCFQTIHRLHPDTTRLNDVAYRTGQVVWVHVVHPSGSSGRHIPTWLRGTDGKQGRKGRMAIEAVRAAGTV